MAVEERNQQILKKIFPFKLPPKEIVDGTYFITDAALQFGTGFHQTWSSMLTVIRPDNKLLVPAAALEGESFNLHHLVRETMPKTHVGGRRWAVWLGRNLLKPTTSTIEQVAIPERASLISRRIADIKEIYDHDIRNEGKLRELLSEFIGGFWLNHYAKILPERVSSGLEQAILEANTLFLGLDNLLSGATHRYDGLDTGDKELVDKSFSLTFAVNLPTPRIYLNDEVTKMLKNTNSREYLTARSPYEIATEPRGIASDCVQAIYIPDAVKGSRTEDVALRKLQVLGIGNDKIHRFSEIIARHQLNVYDNCLQRYEKFTMDDALNAVRTGALVPILN